MNAWTEFRADPSIYVKIDPTRAVIAGGSGGGQTSSDYISFSSKANAASFGTLYSSGFQLTCGGFSNGVFGVVGHTNLLNKFIFSNLSSMVFWGRISTGTTYCHNFSNRIVGVNCGGYVSSGTKHLESFILSTSGNGVEFGSLISARFNPGGACNHTRGLIEGGHGDSASTIEYITMSSLSNSILFGNLPGIRYRQAASANDTRALFSGGAGTNIIDYVDLATLGNASVFGNLTVSGRECPGLVTSGVMGIICGGGETPKNVIDYVTMSTLSNATDWGDLIVTRGYTASSSNFVAAN